MAAVEWRLISARVIFARLLFLSGLCSLKIAIISFHFVTSISCHPSQGPLATGQRLGEDSRFRAPTASGGWSTLQPSHIVRFTLKKKRKNKRYGDGRVVRTTHSTRTTEYHRVEDSHITITKTWPPSTRIAIRTTTTTIVVLQSTPFSPDALPSQWPSFCSSQSCSSSHPVPSANHSPRGQVTLAAQTL